MKYHLTSKLNKIANFFLLKYAADSMDEQTKRSFDMALFNAWATVYEKKFNIDLKDPKNSDLLEQALQAFLFEAIGGGGKKFEIEQIEDIELDDDEEDMDEEDIDDEEEEEISTSIESLEDIIKSFEEEEQPNPMPNPKVPQKDYSSWKIDKGPKIKGKPAPGKLLPPKIKTKSTKGQIKNFGTNENSTTVIVEREDGSKVRYNATGKLTSSITGMAANVISKFKGSQDLGTVEDVLSDILSGSVIGNIFDRVSQEKIFNPRYTIERGEGFKPINVAQNLKMVIQNSILTYFNQKSKNQSLEGMVGGEGDERELGSFIGIEYPQYGDYQSESEIVTEISNSISRTEDTLPEDLKVNIGIHRPPSIENKNDIEIYFEILQKDYNFLNSLKNFINTNKHLLESIFKYKLVVTDKRTLKLKLERDTVYSASDLIKKIDDLLSQKKTVVREEQKIFKEKKYPDKDKALQEYKEKIEKIKEDFGKQQEELKSQLLNNEVDQEEYDRFLDVLNKQEERALRNIETEYYTLSYGQKSDFKLRPTDLARLINTYKLKLALKDVPEIKFSGEKVTSPSEDDILKFINGYKINTFNETSYKKYLPLIEQVIAEPSNPVPFHVNVVKTLEHAKKDEEMTSTLESFIDKAIKGIMDIKGVGIHVYTALKEKEEEKAIPKKPLPELSEGSKPIKPIIKKTLPPPIPKKIIKRPPPKE